MKKIFFFGSPKNTLWDEEQCNLPFERAKTKYGAKIWVATQEMTLIQNIEMNMVTGRDPPKLAIVWTHEPYFCKRNGSEFTMYKVPFLYFTVWNHKALFHNGTFLFQNYPTSFPERPSPRTTWRSTGKKVVALLTYPQPGALATQYRATVAMNGYEKSMIDIYGKGWPNGISKGNSRDGEWWKSKPGILEQYDFNLAMENCEEPYYVTEKLWDSIVNGCLPIYNSKNSKIYETFPTESFLDVAKYSSLEKLWEHVNTMTLEEWNMRYFACWDAMETLWNSFQQDPDILWRKSKEVLLEAMTKFEHL